MQPMYVLWLLEFSLAKSEQVPALISIVPGLGAVEFEIYVFHKIQILITLIPWWLQSC